ncbi:MAG: nucleotide exchange factor GrpE [Lachnospiraceae bacterium]|nr:nucleotide exchange factor GrpE [Lachnospiraceae bacterium]
MSQDKRTEEQIDIEETAAAEGCGREPKEAEHGAGGQEGPGEDPAESGAEDKDGKAGESTGSRKDPKDAQIEELQDKLKRQIAEFDNFRKRTDKEKSAMYEIGARDIIEKILPVLDNFERGLAAVPEDVKDSSFADGVAMIYKQFVKTLEDAGVEAIEAVGQQFDPNLHNAVMHIDDDAYGENEISQELQKGYKYRGTVVRHSMVQVAN